MSSKLPDHPGKDGTLRGGARSNGGRPPGSTRLSKGRPDLASNPLAPTLSSTYVDQQRAVALEGIRMHLRGKSWREVATLTSRNIDTCKTWRHTFPDLYQQAVEELQSSRQAFYEPYIPDAAKALTDAFKPKSGLSHREWAADRVLDGYFGRVGYDQPPSTTAVQVNITFGSHKPSSTPVTIEHEESSD